MGYDRDRECSHNEIAVSTTAMTIDDAIAMIVGAHPARCVECGEPARAWGVGDDNAPGDAYVEREPGRYTRVRSWE